MRLSRRQFTKEFKLAAAWRLEHEDGGEYPGELSSYRTFRAFPSRRDGLDVATPAWKSRFAGSDARAMPKQAAETQENQYRPGPRMCALNNGYSPPGVDNRKRFPDYVKFNSGFVLYCKLLLGVKQAETRPPSQVTPKTPTLAR